MPETLLFFLLNMYVPSLQFFKLKSLLGGRLFIVTDNQGKNVTDWAHSKCYDS